MGIFQGIADLGVMGGGYERTDAAIAERDYTRANRKRQDQLNEMAFQEAIRKDELVKKVREAMGAVKSRAAMKGLGLSLPAENDPYQEHVTPPQGGIDSPESPDAAGKMQAASRALMEGGDIEGATKVQKALEEFKREGFTHFLGGVIRGEDPKAIAEKFNQFGDKRIVGGTKTADGYRFKYEDGTDQDISKAEANRLATGLGLIKRSPLQVVPAGSTVIDPASGKPVYTAPAKPGTDQLAAIEARRKADLEKIAARAKAQRDLPPAVIRSIEGLEKRGMSFEQALAVVNTAKGKPKAELIIDQAAKLKAADAVTGKYDKEGGTDRLVEDATKLVEQAEVRAKGKAPVTIEPAKKAPYVGKDGKPVTMERIESTAKKYGKTIQQVIADLGLTQSK